ncbi:MAG: tyrosine-type recombinase/integrase [Bacteroidota bacterium]
MVTQFIQHISSEKRLSQHTIKAYTNDLLQFELFLKNESPESEILTSTFHEVRAWIVQLSDNQLNSKSINRKIATLKSYFKYLFKHKLIEVDPTLRVKSLKIKKSLPSFAKENEMNAVLDIQPYQSDFEGVRDKVVMELLYGTGIRLSEIINLAETDLDLYTKQIKVTGKRNKQRIIPLNHSLTELLTTYLKLKKDKFGGNELIMTDLGKKAYPMFIQRITEKYLGSNTHLKKKSPHVLRHTFATHLLNEGADLNAIKDLLGHSSLAATQVYTHNSIKKLKDIHKLAHPKA